MTPAKRKAQAQPGRRHGLELRSDDGRSAGRMRVLGAAAFDCVAVWAGKRVS
jgi:hypothetical protein